MINTLVQACNMTPENFTPPSKEVLDMVQHQLEREIEVNEDQRKYEMECFNQEIKIISSSGTSIDDEYFHWES